MTKSQLSRVLRSQKHYITKHYGELAAKAANYGWVSDDSSYSTKVYFQGVLTTTFKHNWISHKFEPFTFNS